MNSDSSTVLVSENIGNVSTLTVAPNHSKAVLVLAHGAGANMRHRFMDQLATMLAERSIATVRFNFPYMEKGGKRPDVPAVAEKTVETVLADTQRRFGAIPVFLAGKSFGGRMSSQYASKKQPAGVTGLIFFGFPLHAPGKADVQRAAHLTSVKVPMLFLQGTRDALATMTLIQEVCAGLPQSTLVKFEGADHSFKVKSKELLTELVESTSHWIEQLLEKR
jgi:predicted alpha/beta-hydrolase family hydrolase